MFLILLLFSMCVVLSWVCMLFFASFVGLYSVYIYIYLFLFFSVVRSLCLLFFKYTFKLLCFLCCFCFL